MFVYGEEYSNGYDRYGGCELSRLVLGGASFGKLSQLEVDRILNFAHDRGITKIDTARGYPNSEKRIGSYLKMHNAFRVNTKVGLPDPSLFTPKGIRDSLEISLRNLNTERVGTLFIHSLPKSFFTDKNIGEMVKLKQDGKVERIGYSGDGTDLESALCIEAMDDFMFTYNIIDQSNSFAFSKMNFGGEAYIKIPLAQGIWRSLQFDRQIASSKLMRFLFNKPPLPESWIDYKRRFQKLRGTFLSREYPSEFLKFSLYAENSKQFVVLGTSSLVHIEEAIQIESKVPDQQDIFHYKQLWNDESSLNWRAHT